MQATEFCYWLQGAFELAQVGELTAAQIIIIRRHLDLVDATVQKTQPAEATKYVSWLRGALDMMVPENVTKTRIVQVKLHGVFQHAIDPQQEAKPGMDLNAAHFGIPEPGVSVGNPDPSKPVARC
jgi:hypothetical protein